MRFIAHHKTFYKCTMSKSVKLVTLLVKIYNALKICSDLKQLLDTAKINTCVYSSKPR